MRKRNYKFIKLILIIIIFILIVFIVHFFNKTNDLKNEQQNIAKINDKISKIYDNNQQDNTILNESNNEQNIEQNNEKNNIKKIDDWRLILVNFENIIPEDFKIDLTSIDKYRQIDSRVFPELMQMIKDMKKSGVSNIWIQSAYRSIDRQEKLYYDRVKEYMNKGKTQEEAEKLTSQTINKPETSEHNLGLAVDFNYVNYNFEKTKEYKWLLENAENYGFILRYPKDKEDITRVAYEPWHWRYVGVEHAKKINELKLCLEEYVEYLLEN